MAIFKKKTQEAAQTASDKSTGSAKVAYMVRPHITEKAFRMSEEGQYVFEVTRDASKNEVKKEVERLYNVEVIKVQSVIKMHKPQSYRGLGQKRPLSKKMIVRVKEGQKIDFSTNQ